MTTAHKHADVLRAIADGVPLSEFEIRCESWGKTKTAGLDVGYSSWLYEPEKWTIRRKPITHVVNGFTVPAPVTSLKLDQQYYLISIFDGKPKAEVRFNANMQLGAEHCKRGIAHPTEKAAVANASAILGINPEAV